ncbi:MAG: LytR C-terminal domain-containing protein [Deltaproteobacteria bacterium]|nr:LytR C-terminal domain-containing protein [Deltaproteobacteria bacterium]
MLPHESRSKSLRDAFLKTGAFGLAWLAAVLLIASCNIRQSGQLPDKFWAGVRPASGDTERLMKNFRYLKAAGRTELALKELEEAHYQDPGNLQIIDILAQCYEELGAWERAEKLYLQALDRDPDNPALANNLCFSYYQAGRFDKAEACFRDLLKRQPQNATVRNNLGLLLVKTGRQEQAFRLWREHENDATAKTRLNQALAALGMTPQMDVASAGEAKKEAAAAPAAQAMPVKPQVAEPSPVQTALSPVQTASQAQPLTAAPARTEETAAVPVMAEQPKQSEPQTAPAATAAVQDVMSVSAPLPAAAVPGTPKESVKPEPAAHSALSAGQTALKPAAERTEIRAQATTESASAPVKPPVIQASSPKSPPAAAVATVQPSPAQTPSPARAEPQAALAAASPDKAKGKTATRKLAAPAADASQPAPRRATILTVEELLNTRLDIRNGNGLQGIAALNRTWLTMEGFHVAAIGNHLDFGKEKTEISYQPQAERVAQVLREDFFPGADLKASDKLGKDTDVRITLGHDQKARKAKIEERVALLDLRAQLAVMLASSGKSEKASAVAATPKKAELQTTQSRKNESPESPAQISVSEPVNAQPVLLTAEELTKTKIELRNGNGVQDQARKLRAEMEVQGFTVVRIKNHIDFGMAQTKILHRSPAQRVARALNQKYFRSARLEEAANLPEDVDVKIILGKDLSGGLNLMAKAD